MHKWVINNSDNTKIATGGHWLPPVYVTLYSCKLAFLKFIKPHKYLHNELELADANYFFVALFFCHSLLLRLSNWENRFDIVQHVHDSMISIAIVVLIFLWAYCILLIIITMVMDMVLQIDLVTIAKRVIILLQFTSRFYMRKCYGENDSESHSESVMWHVHLK